MCAIFFAFDFVQNESMRKTIALQRAATTALLVNFSAIGIAGVMSKRRQRHLPSGSWIWSRR